ncbi:DNA/RNA helicase domain-containing protein [Candidatus Lokiarchaeum ossiferum]|uniref:DNA/RNA helicase domain-containing protein n=1 Tax=Candidatus Lokiarchaeum ossiferum TaxID=2951803 RepID=UPI00352DD297
MKQKRHEKKENHLTNQNSLDKFFKEEKESNLVNKKSNEQFLAGWNNSILKFLNYADQNILDELERRLPSNDLQIKAWEHTIKGLKSIFINLIEKYPVIGNYWIIFEYELLFEGGRRPDIIILTENKVLVIEVKDQSEIKTNDIEQTKAYTRDIKEYHSFSQEFETIGILLILNLSNACFKKKNNIKILNLKSLKLFISKLNSSGIKEETAFLWLQSPYHPLPTLIQSAKIIFEDKPLPHIKRVENYGIPKTLQFLHDLTRKAKEENSYHLLLIGGVPGSGKTLVGLQFAHEISNDQEYAMYLSGNQPLVKVLQDYLGKTGKVFVREVRAFIDEYWIKKRDINLSDQKIIIFDEAQRAWDGKQVKKHYKKQKNEFLEISDSEPEIIVNLVSMMKDWGIIIGLIGDGQKIHSGEEKGIDLWYDALLDSNKKWTVHLPPRMGKIFDLRNDKKIKIKINSRLDLTETLRSHAAKDLHRFTNHLLDGEISDAKEYATKMKNNGYSMLLTSELGLGKAYLQARYDEDDQFTVRWEDKKTYGIICSSKAKNLVKYGINSGKYKDPNCFCTKIYGANDVPRWFNYRASRSKLFCSNFKHLTTEFHCQGLEIDGALIAWGSDLVYSGNEWIPYIKGKNIEIKSKFKLNAYRVLLTRARDGFIIFCPKTPEMQKTYETLHNAGLDEINPSMIQEIRNSSFTEEIDDFFNENDEYEDKKFELWDDL